MCVLGQGGRSEDKACVVKVFFAEGVHQSGDLLVVTGNQAGNLLVADKLLTNPQCRDLLELTQPSSV